MPCHCIGSGDPVVSSYDGAQLMVLHDQKTHIAGWGTAKDEAAKYEHECKFMLRSVTKVDIDKEPTPNHYDWIGFGFGQQSNRLKSWRNFIFGQTTTGEALVGIRGKGISGTGLPDSNPFNVTQTLGDGTSCEWSVEEIDSHFVTLRSSCCEYAINWRPNMLKTSWEMFVGGFYRDGSMSGMCGDCNGNNVDDFRGCPNIPIYDVDTYAAMSNISNSCASGIHAGNNFKGGARLNSLID